MPDSKPPQGNPAPAEPDLLWRMAELEPETAELLAELRERVRRSWEELQLVEHCCDSVDCRGAVTPSRRTGLSR
jgi:hypothetical protein